MNIKNEKGITNIDITITVIIITLFIGIIAVLLSNVNSNSKSIERRSEATNYAINAIETIKTQKFEELKDGETEEDVKENSSYHKKVIITDYAKLQGNENAVEGLVKKVTVQISYKDGKHTETVELSTVITKND